MKKRIISLLTVLALVLTLGTASFASAQLDYVTDAAGLLSAEAYQSLEQTARTISERYGCGVYLVLVDDYTEYAGSDDGMYEFAKYLYQDYELGLGSDESGVLLVLSMNDRKYGLVAHGNVGNGAFTDYGKDCMEDAFVAAFKEDDWVGGFEIYLSTCESYLQQYSQGTPFDGVGSSSSGFTFGRVLSNLFLGALIAIIVCLTQKKKMKTAVQQTDANAYVVPGSVTLRHQVDQFTHVTKEVTHISHEKRGGGGTSVDRDGFSGGSGSF